MPDAPRIAEQGFPATFDWKFLPPKFFSSSAMKGAVSEFNLNSMKSNGMKPSASAFEILSRSNTNLSENTHEEEQVDESFEQKEIEKIERPKTYKYVNEVKM